MPEKKQAQPKPKEIPLTEQQHRLLQAAIAERDAADRKARALVDMALAGAGVDSPVAHANVVPDRPVLEYIEG